MTTALDGSNSGIFSTTNVKTLTLSTTNPGDVIICIVANEKNAGGFTTVSSISNTAGLTWTLHKQLQWSATVGNVTKQDLEVWWAVAPSALTGDTITVNLNQNTDDSCVVVFGVSGADTVTPFDTDASIPASASDVTGGNVARAVAGISTVNAATFMFAAMADAQNQSATTPTGFTNIASPNNPNGGLFEYMAVDYKIHATAQSGITVTEGGTGSNFGMIVTAIREAQTDIDIGPVAVDLGVSMAAAIQKDVSASAAPSLGISMAAAVQAEADETAAVALGVSMSAAVIAILSVTAAGNLGVTMATHLSALVKPPQPVIIVAS